MHRHLRLAGIGAAAAIAGVGAAIAAGAASGDGVRACAVQTSGKVVARQGNTCPRGQLAITISGNAFKASKNRTLTINGVAFKGDSGRRGITINGQAFRSSKNGTLTINGVAFRQGPRDTLTINGVPFTPGAGTQTGPAGLAGPIGPPGPAGAAGGAARSGAPVEVPGPVDATLGGDPADLASAPLTIADGTAHRVLLAGGFDAACVGVCASPAQAVFDVRRNAGGPAFTRRLPQFSAAGITGMSGTFSEVVDAPADCVPCTFTLRLQAAGAAGGGASTIRATAIRLAVVDLGPAGGG